MARAVSPAVGWMSAAANRRRRASAGLAAGVSRSACSASGGGGCGSAARRHRAASSSVAAISASASSVARARWRARSSAVGTSCARRRCSDPARASTAADLEPSSGCVKRRRSVQLEDPCCSVSGARPRRRPAAARRAAWSGRRAQRRRGQPRALGAEIVEALLQEPAEVGGTGWLARGEHAAAASAARQLEREEGVAARRLPDPEQGRPRGRWSRRTRRSSWIAPTLRPPTWIVRRRSWARRGAATPARCPGRR